MRISDWSADVCSSDLWNEGLGEVVWAEKGAGAWRGVLDTALADFERLQVSTIERLDKATLSTGNIATLARAPQWAELGRLIPQLHRIRGYGDFLHYHYLRPASSTRSWNPTSTSSTLPRSRSSSAKRAASSVI